MSCSCRKGARCLDCIERDGLIYDFPPSAPRVRSALGGWLYERFMRDGRPRGPLWREPIAREPSPPIEWPAAFWPAPDPQRIMVSIEEGRAQAAEEDS